MTFTAAAKIQYRRETYYNVLAVSPAGETTILGATQRKSGHGLILFCRGKSIGEKLRAIGFFGGKDGKDVSLRKTKSSLILGDGWVIKFGDTIRQAAV